MVPDKDRVDDTVEQASRGTDDRNTEPDGDAEEASGNMRRDYREKKLMHTVLQADKDNIDHGKAVREAANQNVGAFSPDMAFQTVVNNYREAERLYGDTLLRELTGYDSEYIERNKDIPEFQRDLQKQIKQNVDDLRRSDVVNDDYQPTSTGYDVAALHLIDEELDELNAKGLLGSRASDDRYHVGEAKGYTRYSTSQPYQDISSRRTVKVAARRGQAVIRPVDLRLHDRRGEGGVDIVFCVDTSGSMTGSKIEAAKKAGVALSHRSASSNDDVGLVMFSNAVEEVARVGSDTRRIAEALVRASPGGETDISVGLTKALSMLSGERRGQHILLLTDALQTRGEQPIAEVQPVVGRARSRGVGVSVLGVNLDENGRRLADHIVRESEGSLYMVRNTESMDAVVIDAYDAAT